MSTTQLQFTFNQTREAPRPEQRVTMVLDHLTTLSSARRCSIQKPHTQQTRAPCDAMLVLLGEEKGVCLQPKECGLEERRGNQPGCVP